MYPSLSARPAIYRQLPITVNITITTHIITIVYDAVHGAPHYTKSNQLVSPSPCQDAYHQLHNHRFTRPRPTQTNHHAILQKSLANRPEANVHDLFTIRAHKTTRTCKHNYFMHRYHSSTTSTISTTSTTHKPSSHQTQHYRPASADTLGHFLRMSTSWDSQKHTAASATPPPPAYPATPNSFGHTDLPDGMPA